MYNEKIPVQKQLKRFNISWQPAFSYIRGSKDGTEPVKYSRIYIIGEKKKYVGEGRESDSNEVGAEFSQDFNTFSLNEILRVANNSKLIIPLNSSVALAQEYTPKIKNKLLKLETRAGNTVHTFGQGFKQIGLRITIVKAGRHWEEYVKGLEAISTLSSNEKDYFGNLWLDGFDKFSDGTEKVSSRYKVVVDSLEFAHRSDKNTTVNADLQMTVLKDYSYFLTQKEYWG
jgi:hypothetical protein